MRSAIAITAAGFPGSASALSELADATGLLHAVAVHGADDLGAEGQFVQALLDDRRTRLLILGGWSPAYEPFVAAATSRNVAVAVYWNSSTGQTGMSVEVERLSRCLDDSRVTHRWFVQRSFADALHHAKSPCLWMPNVIAMRTRRLRRTDTAMAKRTIADQTVDVGLFCSPHEYARKNVLTTLAAVARLGPSVRLHLNGLSNAPAYRPWLDRLGIRWIEHGWMSRASYFETVAGLDLGLQVSFAESFNYVAADHILAGVPVVVSPMVPVVTGLSASLVRPFVTPTADDPAVVASVIQRVLDHPRWARQRTQAIRTALLASQRLALARARRIVREAIGGLAS